MNKKRQTVLSLAGTQVLKAFAILSVILIHVLSSIKPSPFVNESSYQLFAVSLDQILRISVPLFVALSGYGLYWKYAKEKFKLISFFKSRVFKILPQYVFWSFIFYILFYLVPIWGSATEQPSFLWQLILGRADYHLYFVPMIFQIYLFFPLILKLYKKWPIQTLLVSVAIQLVWWNIFSYGGKTVTSLKYFENDGEQYLWMTNWIAYFVLGMFLPRLWQWFDRNKIVFLLFFVTLIGSTVYTILNAHNAILVGVDPLFALKFTRYPLFIYSSLAIVVVSYLVARCNVGDVKNRGNGFLKRVGEISYPLYLSHTLFLRVFFFLIYL